MPFLEYPHHMKPVHILLDEAPLEAADDAVRRTLQNRSAMVTDALREPLMHSQIRPLEECDREGYAQQPPAQDESQRWEHHAAWGPE